MIVLPMRASRRWRGLALVIVLLPTITRTTEEMLRLFPGTLREAALRWAPYCWVVRQVVIPGRARASSRRHSGDRSRRGRDGAAALHRLRQPY